MSFEYPYILLMIPLLIACELLCKRKGVAQTIFSHTEFLKPERGFERLLYLLLFITLIIALAHPYKKRFIGTTHTKGRNIVIVLDNSPSMYWSFGKSDKITTAKEIIKEFISNRGFDNIGLVLFAGEVYYLSPITTNHSYIYNMLNLINKEFLEGGTALYDSINYAVRVFKESKTKDNILIVLTDGEDTASSLTLNQLQNSLQYANAKIYTIGIGNSINEDVLKSLGEYHNATDPSTLQAIYKKIDKIEKYDVSVKKHYKIVYYFYEVLLVSFAILILMIGREYAVFKR